MSKPDNRVTNAATDMGASLGIRCGPEADPVEDRACVQAAACVMTALINLRELSRVQSLNPNHLQAMIDGFMDHAQVTESSHPMGGYTYQRKAKE